MNEHESTKVMAGRFDLLPMDGVLFGPGSIDQVAGECERLGMSKILLVISPSLAKATDIEAHLHDLLGDRIAQTYSGSLPHVPDTVVLEASAEARAAGVDGLLSVGGGSPIDLAKAINLCLTENVTTADELNKFAVKFTYPDIVEVPPMSSRGIPHVSISTTLSAGEFTNIVGITDTTELVKNLYIDNALVPRIVIHDPELAVHTPRQLWASTGMRSVDHAVEALCSTNAQPMTDALCADALRRLVTYLPISAADPNDLYAASQCQMGAWQSIFGLTNVKLGLSHGIGHQLGARNGVPHGVTSCVMLPTVLDYNYEYTKDQQAHIGRIFAECMGVPAPEDGAGAIVRQFVTELGLPTTLSEVGVTREDFPLLARDAMHDLIVATNPRSLAGEPDVIKVLEQAF